MISIVVGLGFLFVIACVYIIKLQFELNELHANAKVAMVKHRLLIDYIDTLSKVNQTLAKKEKK